MDINNTKNNVNNKLTSSNNKKINNFYNTKENQNVYSSDEINNLSYELAIKYDKRTYCEYYISLLKLKNIFLFTFFNNDDYNSKIIKIDLFFIRFTVYYAVNELFFSDDTMHKIYETKGSFNLEYQLPITIYSSLISMFLNIILNSLALSNDSIIDFKNDKNKEDVLKRRDKLIFKLKIKFIFYYFISFIFLLCFWYYISMFGAIYRNTQVHLLKDTLISFAISMFIPFIINLLPGLFRIPALSSEKKEKGCLYKFSKIIQLFL